MMKRLFLLGVGVAAGVALYRKLEERTTASGRSGGTGSPPNAAAAVLAAARNFVDDMKSAMNEREHHLHAVLSDETATPGDVRAVFVEPSYSGRHAAP